MKKRITLDDYPTLTKEEKKVLELYYGSKYVRDIEPYIYMTRQMSEGAFIELSALTKVLKTIVKKFEWVVEEIKQRNKGGEK